MTTNIEYLNVLNAAMEDDSLNEYLMLRSLDLLARMPAIKSSGRKTVAASGSACTSKRTGSDMLPA